LQRLIARPENRYKIVLLLRLCLNKTVANGKTNENVPFTQFYGLPMTDPDEQRLPKELVGGGGEPVGLTAAGSTTGGNGDESGGESGDRQAEQAQAMATSLPKIIPFSSLVRCGDEVWIEHAGNLYRLRRTKQDKLILTK